MQRPSARRGETIVAQAELVDAIGGAAYLLADSKLVQAKEVCLTGRQTLYMAAERELAALRF